MKSKAGTVSEYLAELPPDRRKALTQLRALVRKIAPDAVETMEYGMPAYTLGGLLCALASQKNYMALYCCETEVVEAHRKRLGKLNCGNFGPTMGLTSGQTQAGGRCCWISSVRIVSPGTRSVTLFQTESLLKFCATRLCWWASIHQASRMNESHQLVVLIAESKSRR